jgi:hypothetical protein
MGGVATLLTIFEFIITVPKAEVQVSFPVSLDQSVREMSTALAKRCLYLAADCARLTDSWFLMRSRTEFLSFPYARSLGSFLPFSSSSSSSSFVRRSLPLFLLHRFLVCVRTLAISVGRTQPRSPSSSPANTDFSRVSKPTANGRGIIRQTKQGRERRRKERKNARQKKWS